MSLVKARSIDRIEPAVEHLRAVPSMPMNVEPVSIPTPTVPLDGLFYTPPGPVRGAVQLFHGNTMNFYVGPPRFLAPALVEAGYACLSYNRRGHDVLSNRNSRDLEGGAYQTIDEMVEDNLLASQFLAERGLPAPILVGHSNGGMLAVRHAVDHPETPAIVLLSAHRGGTGLLKKMADRGMMAGDRYDEITERALELVGEGRGDELMLVPGWWYVIAARTYVEYLTKTPDLVEMATRISCPTLFVRGSLEPADLYPAEEFASRAPGPVEIRVLEGCDHYYVGCEERVAGTVVDWLEQVG
jgi:pimeloyl-ACP methyl ester carboxylesterase